MFYHNQNKHEIFKYYIELYQGVSIDRVFNDKGEQLPNIREIRKDGKTLVTITTDPDLDKNNVTFKLVSSLVGKELDNAIKIMIDQIIRHQEKSQDDRFEIYGYTNNPEVALRIYSLAISLWARPKIRAATVEKWEKKSKDKHNPNQGKFIQALATYKKYHKFIISPKKFSDLNKNFENIEPILVRVYE